MVKESDAGMLVQSLGDKWSPEIVDLINKSIDRRGSFEGRTGVFNSEHRLAPAPVLTARPDDNVRTRRGGFRPRVADRERVRRRCRP